MTSSSQPLMEQTPLNATDQAILIVGIFISVSAISFTLWAIWLSARRPHKSSSKCYRKQVTRRR